MTRADSVLLPADALAPSQARAWFAERGRSLSPQILYDGLLIVSELVTNAVRHGRPDVVLSVRPAPQGVHIAVADQGSALPEPPTDRPSLDRPSGRGLLIVAATAQAWGITAHDPGPGKTVWAELIDTA